jgi:hypothetical protein
MGLWHKVFCISNFGEWERVGKSRLSDYQYSKVCQAELQKINLLFATTYPSMEAAEIDAGCDRRTIASFLRGKRVRRKHFLGLCKVLGIAPLVAMGTQNLVVATNKEKLSDSELPKDLRLAEFDQVMDFVQTQRQLGLVVQITEHDSNICHYTSKEMPPERLGGKNSDPLILKNHNYFENWKKAGSLDLYFKMRDYLEKDGWISEYIYPLVRTSDGALVEYSCDFHLIRDFLGKPVRIVSSPPEAFRVLSA